MSGFKIGEICTAHSLVDDTRYNGMDCAIVSGLHSGCGIHVSTGRVSTDSRYFVKFVDGSLGRVKPCNLRKRRPPASDDAAYRQAMLDCIERAKMPQEIPA